MDCVSLSEGYPGRVSDQDRKKLKPARSKAEVVRTITGIAALILQAYVAYRVSVR